MHDRKQEDVEDHVSNAAIGGGSSDDDGGGGDRQSSNNNNDCSKKKMDPLKEPAAGVVSSLTCLMMRMNQLQTGMTTEHGIRMFDYCHKLMTEIKAAKSQSSPTSTSAMHSPACQQSHQHVNGSFDSRLEDIEQQSNFLFRESDTSPAEVQRIGTVVRRIRIKQEKQS